MEWSATIHASTESRDENLREVHERGEPIENTAHGRPAVVFVPAKSRSGEYPLREFVGVVQIIPFVDDRALLVSTNPGEVIELSNLVPGLLGQQYSRIMDQRNRACKMTQYGRERFLRRLLVEKEHVFRSYSPHGESLGSKLGGPKVALGNIEEGVRLLRLEPFLLPGSHGVSSGYSFLPSREMIIGSPPMALRV